MSMARRDIKNQSKKVRKSIKLSDNDLRKLKKHRRVTGKDYIIDVVEGNVKEIRYFGR